MANVEPEKHNYDWKIMLSMNNDVVLISVCVLLLIQLVLSVLLVYYRSTRGKVPIYMFWKQGSNFSPEHAYIITVVTGSRRGAGTVGEVRINIQGTHSTNDDFSIGYNSFNEDDELQLLRRGSIDMFLITSDDPLGDLQFIEVELSTSKRQVEWYLCYVTVLDLVNQINWYFPCHQWLTATSRGPQTFVLPSDIRWHCSLLRDNFCRGMREFHSVLAPWCSILYSTQLHAAYNLILCISIITCFMLTHILVFCSPFSSSNTFGYEYFALTSELNNKQIVYLIIADVFLAAVFTTLQLLMHVVKLRSGSFFHNYYVVQLFGRLDSEVTNTIIAQSIIRNSAETSNNSNVGHVYLHRIQEALHDKRYTLHVTSSQANEDDAEFCNQSNNNLNTSCGVEFESLAMWESLWKDLLSTDQHRKTSSTESLISNVDTTTCEDILTESFIRSIYTRCRDNDGTESYLEQEFQNLLLKHVLGQVYSDASSLMSSRISDDCASPRYDDNQQVEMNTADSKHAFYSCHPNLTSVLQFTLPPVAEYISQSIAAQVINNVLFWVEHKSLSEIRSLVGLRSMVFRKLWTAAGCEKVTYDNEDLVHSGPLWDYSAVSKFTAASCLPVHRATMLSQEQLLCVANAVERNILYQGALMQTVHSTVNVYIDQEAQVFCQTAVQTLLNVFKFKQGEQKTLVTNEIILESDAAWMFEFYFIPLVINYVRQMMQSQIKTCQYLANDVKLAALTVQFLYCVVSVVDLKMYTDLCKVLTARSDKVWLKRVIDTHIEHDGLQLSYTAVLMALQVESTHAQRYLCGCRGSCDVIDFHVVDQVILLQVMVDLVKLLMHTSDISYLYDFRSIFIESALYIIELVVLKAKSCLSQQIETVHANILNCNVQLLTDFAEFLLSPHQRVHDVYMSVFKSVDTLLWTVTLEISCRHVAQQILDDRLMVTRVPRNKSTSTKDMDITNGNNMNNNTNDYQSDDAVNFNESHRSDELVEHHDTAKMSSSTAAIITTQKNPVFDDQLPVQSAIKMSIKLVPEHNQQKLRNVWKGSRMYRDCFPTVVTYFLLVLLMVLCIVSVGGCLSIGTYLPTDVAHHWLSSVLTAVLIHAVAFEPLKVLAIAIFYAYGPHKLLM